MLYWRFFFKAYYRVIISNPLSQSADYFFLRLIERVSKREYAPRGVVAEIRRYLRNLCQSYKWPYREKVLFFPLFPAYLCVDIRKRANRGLFVFEHRRVIQVYNTTTDVFILRSRCRVGGKVSGGRYRCVYGEMRRDIFQACECERGNDDEWCPSGLDTRTLPERIHICDVRFA